MYSDSTANFLGSVFLVIVFFVGMIFQGTVIDDDTIKSKERIKPIYHIVVDQNGVQDTTFIYKKPRN